MVQEYRVPKHAIPAEITLAGRRPLSVRLFVSDRAESHSGAERPSDVLNGPQRFLPAVDDAGALALLNSEAITVVSVDARWEIDPEATTTEDLPSGDAVVVRLEVTLDDGSAIRGSVSYLLPESHRRIQDYLNEAERFLVLRQESAVHLINKRHIVRVSPQ